LDALPAWTVRINDSFRTLFIVELVTNWFCDDFAWFIFIYDTKVGHKDQKREGVYMLGK